MTDLSIFLHPLEAALTDAYADKHPLRLGAVLNAYTAGSILPHISTMDVALIGVKDDRGSRDNEGCAYAPDEVRKHLYNLFPGKWNLRIADLGNINQGNTVNDTYFALAEILAYLISNRVFPIVIGGSQDLTMAMYRAYAQIGKIMNIAVIDSMFDLGEEHEELHSRSYLSHIIMQKPNYLFNYTNIGYQSYFVDPKAVELMDKLYFDTWRLGVIKEDIREAEPLVRNADLLSVDMGAIRAADGPGSTFISPNGFTGEEMCRLVRYATMSDKLSSAGFFEMNPVRDQHGLTAHLLAQMIWYALEGLSQRQQDYPVAGSDEFIKYIVPSDSFEQGLIFYKSRKTGRWWMEVKNDETSREKYASHLMMPCSHSDYEEACRNEIPPRWWQLYRKMV